MCRCGVLEQMDPIPTPSVRRSSMRLASAGTPSSKARSSAAPTIPITKVRHEPLSISAVPLLLHWLSPVSAMDEASAARSPLTPDSQIARGLSDARIEQFIRDGFVKMEGAFPRELADQGRSILWRDTGCDEGDPKTWTKPVIRLGMYGQAPFVRAANTPVLHKAFDQLAGPGRWRPRMDLAGVY